MRIVSALVSIVQWPRPRTGGVRVKWSPMFGPVIHRLEPHQQQQKQHSYNNNFFFMDSDAKIEQERFREKMSEGDKAIREILHLLEDSSSKMSGDDDGSSSQTRTLLHHAILCASFLCLVLFLAIIVLHRKYSRLSRMSSPSPNPDSQNQILPMDTVIVINDERRTETEITCDHRMHDSTNV